MSHPQCLVNIESKPAGIIATICLPGGRWQLSPTNTQGKRLTNNSRTFGRDYPFRLLCLPLIEIQDR